MADKKDLFGIKADNNQHERYVPQKGNVVSRSPAFIALLNAMPKFAVAEEHFIRTQRKHARDKTDELAKELEEARESVQKHWLILKEAGY